LPAPLSNLSVVMPYLYSWLEASCRACSLAASEERWSEDVSEDVAHELRRRCDLQMRELLVSISDFVEQHEGHIWRQLTLRLVQFDSHFAVRRYLIGMRRVELHRVSDPRNCGPGGPDWIHEIKHDG
jgi:hypothetical protein